MAITPVADNAPPVSATTQPSDPPPAEEEAPLMEVVMKAMTAHPRLAPSLLGRMRY